MDLNGAPFNVGVVVPQIVYEDNRYASGRAPAGDQAPIDFTRGGMLGISITDLISGCVKPEGSVVYRNLSSEILGICLQVCSCPLFMLRSSRRGLTARTVARV
jgi:hypothetical protein